MMSGTHRCLDDRARVYVHIDVLFRVYGDIATEAIVCLPVPSEDSCFGAVNLHWYRGKRLP
jgi:hypothetical protein